MWLILFAGGVCGFFKSWTRYAVLVWKPCHFIHSDFTLLSYSTSLCIWPKGIDDVCLIFVPVTGWTEHLQFMLHTSHWILKVVQLEREVQQWQEPWLHKSKSAHGWPWPGCHTGWARGRWVDPAAVDSWGRRGATQRPRTGTRSCTRKISSTR